MGYHEKGDFNKALEKFNEVLKINEQLGDLSGKANSLNNIGFVFYMKGKIKCRISYNIFLYLIKFRNVSHIRYPENFLLY